MTRLIISLVKRLLCSFICFHYTVSSQYRVYFQNQYLLSIFIFEEERKRRRGDESVEHRRIKCIV